MSALSLFESFCWGMTGGSVVLITQNGVKLHGYRKARKDDHRGAGASRSARTLHIPAGADPTTGEGSGVAPDAIEPIIALRGWGVSHDGFLESAGDDHRNWPARRPLKAECRLDKYGGPAHTSPDRKCRCGIYAVKREPKMQLHSSRIGGPTAWGRVAVWGKIEEAEDGYRAEYAYPVSITLVNGFYNRTGVTGDGMASEASLEKLRANLELHYGVPVRIGTQEELADAKRSSYEAMGLPPEVKELVG